MGLFDALAGIGNTIGNNVTAKQRQGDANAWNYFMWQKQNLYNSPAEQRKRLEEAGFNPVHQYSASQAGQADAPKPFEVVKPDFDLKGGDVLKNFADIQNVKAGTDNLETYKQNIINDAANTAQKTKESIQKTTGMKDANKRANELQAGSLEMQSANIRKINSQIIGQDIDNTVKDETQRAEIKRINYGAQLAKEALNGKELDNSLKDFEKQLNHHGLTKSDPLFQRILYLDGTAEKFRGMGMKLGKWIRDNYAPEGTWIEKFQNKNKD